MRSEKSFRTDINGLRAWAVVSVILYHFGVPAFSGGFVGVDVFFVISGFLMTGIIVEGLDQSRERYLVQLLRFYWARARRIIPALATLCATLLLAAWFVLSPLDYKTLATHSVAALMFLTNIKFWLESGYFDAISHEKWLLHTWSLAVEWQFYIFLPVIMILGWRYSPNRKMIAGLLAIGLVVSFVASVILTPKYPNASFYLLHTRAWEMFAGGLVYLLCMRLIIAYRLKVILELIGFGLILFSVCFFDVNVMWPGAWAVVPVLGTAMVLAAARKNSPWTDTRVAQWIGEISYSLYLWHWPVVVAIAYAGLKNDTAAIAQGLVATVFLAWLAYLLVEKPARYGLIRVGWRPAVIRLSIVVLAVAVPAGVIRLNGGVSGRLDPSIEIVFAEAENRNPRHIECHRDPPAQVPGCTYGGATLGAIVIGDSHAAAVIRSVEKAMARPDLHVLDWTYASCPTLSGVHKIDPKYADYCGRFVNDALTRQRSLPKVPIVIINRASAAVYGPNEVGLERYHGKPAVYFSKQYDTPAPELLSEFRRNLIDTACKFAQDRPTYLVRPIPEMKLDVPKTMGRSLFFEKPESVSISLAEYFQRNQFVLEAQDAASNQCGVTILDPLPYLCHDGRCDGAQDGIPIYADDDHLSERGAALLIPLFSSIFHAQRP